MDKPESNGVEKQNEDMENIEENQHNDAEQCNLDKHKDNNKEGTTHDLHKITKLKEVSDNNLNRDIENVDDISQMSRL